LADLVTTIGLNRPGKEARLLLKEERLSSCEMKKPPFRGEGRLLIQMFKASGV